MLQIPVEGGHHGGDLSIHHKLGTTKLDRSQDNEHKFYLSASFIDSEHEFSPLTEGSSLVFIHYLVWKNPLVVSPHHMDLPTFISARQTVDEILSPWRLPDEDCDTELLVIPLVNDYAKVPLSYSNLRGTDKLMANLLQSTNSLKVRLATVVYYRAGIAHDEHRMNRDREEDDDGYPESPIDVELKAFPRTERHRFVAEVIEESCSIENFYQMNGQVDSSNTPIYWKRDYIYKNIESIKDLFDVVSPPDKEKYDRYHDVEDDLELRQWWYKPVLIFWPKSSIALKCRMHFHDALENLKRRVLNQKNEEEYFANLMYFRSIINYLHRHGMRNFEGDEENQENEGEVPVYRIAGLFSICNLLKAKEEASRICQLYALNPVPIPNWFNVIADYARLVDLAGWKSCRKLFDSFLSLVGEQDEQMVYRIHMTYEFLKVDSPFRNEAAVSIFTQLHASIFSFHQAPNDIKVFFTKLDSIEDLGNNSYAKFVVIVFLVQHRQMLKNANEMLALIFYHLNSTPIDPEKANNLVCLFSSLNFLENSSFGQLVGKAKELLILLCEFALELDVYNFSHHFSSHLAYWIKLFVFVGQWPMIQQLMNTILWHPSLPEKTEPLLKILEDLKLPPKQLNKEAEKKLTMVKGQIQRTINVVLSRRRYEIRQSVSYLKSAVSRPSRASHPFFGSCPSAEDLDQLRQSRIFKVREIISKIRSRDDHFASKEEAEEEFINWCNIIELCNKLESKDDGANAIAQFFYIPKKCFVLRPELLSAVVGFIAFAGLNRFLRCYESFESDLSDLSENGVKLEFFVSLANQLLLKNQYHCREAATELFKRIFHCLDSSLDEQRLIIFYQVILLMDESQFLHIDFPCEIIEAVTECLLQSSISTLHQFVKILFVNQNDRLIVFPCDRLTSLGRSTLEELGRKFVNHIAHNTDSVATEDLLNWMRLIIYVDKFHVSHLLEELMEHLCAGQEISSLRKLVATEEFQNETQFKIVREQPILQDWKRRLQKESFVKLFTQRNKSKKRKVLEEDLHSDCRIQKRARFDDSGMEQPE